MDPRKRVFFLLGLLLVLTGCQEPRLRNGRYFGRDRDEFAMVYKDLIFLRVKAPRNIPRSLPYWEWGGKYSVDPGSRRISFDMERENARLWNFCYNIYSERGAVILQDLTENRRFVLRYETPALDTKPANAPRPYSSPGVNPVYQPLAPIN